MSVEIVFTVPRASEVSQLRNAKLYHCTVVLHCLKTDCSLTMYTESGGLYAKMGESRVRKGKEQLDYDIGLLTNGGERWGNERRTAYRKGESNMKILATQAELQDHNNRLLVQDTLRVSLRLWPFPYSLSLIVRSPAGKDMSITCEVERISILRTGEKVIHKDKDSKVSIFVERKNICVKFQSVHGCCVVLREVLTSRSDGTAEKLWEGSRQLLCDPQKDESFPFTDVQRLMSDTYLPHDRLWVTFKFTDYNRYNYCVPEKSTDSAHPPIQITSARSLKRSCLESDVAQLQECEGDSLKCLAEDLAVMLLSGRFTDFTLKVGSDAIRVHKAMVCSRSRVLESMITTTTSVLGAGNNEVELFKFSVDTVRRLVRFLYTGSVPDLDPRDALELFSAAVEFDVPSLRGVCVRAVALGLCPENVGVVHSDPGLRKAVVEYIGANKNLVLRSPEWATLIRDNPDLWLKVEHGV